MKKGVELIETKCTDKVLRISNIVITGLLCVAAVMRFMWMLGAHEETKSMTIKGESKNEKTGETTK